MNTANELASQSVTLCHMCEAVLLKRKGRLRLELKDSPRIANVTNSDTNS